MSLTSFKLIMEQMSCVSTATRIGENNGILKVEFFGEPHDSATKINQQMSVHGITQIDAPDGHDTESPNSGMPIRYYTTT